MNNNPLSQVGQTPRPEGEQPLPDDGAGDAGAEERQQNQTDEADRSSLQHPADPDSSRAAPAPGNPATAVPRPPAGTPREIRDLAPGEPPPESSAGS